MALNIFKVLRKSFAHRLVDGTEVFFTSYIARTILSCKFLVKPHSSHCHFVVNTPPIGVSFDPLLSAGRNVWRLFLRLLRRGLEVFVLHLDRLHGCSAVEPQSSLSYFGLSFCQRIGIARVIGIFEPLFGCGQLCLGSGFRGLNVGFATCSKLLLEAFVLLVDLLGIGFSGLTLAQGFLFGAALVVVATSELLDTRLDLFVVRVQLVFGWVFGRWRSLTASVFRWGIVFNLY